MISRALQLGVSTILSFDDTPPFARIVVNMMDEWYERNGSYITILQDRGETPCDRFERGIGV